MNHSFLPRPAFWVEASLQKRTKYSVFGELFTFLLVFFIAQLLESFLISIVSSAYLFSSNPEEVFVIDEKGSLDLLATIFQLFSNMPSWMTAATMLASVAFLAAAVVYCLRFEHRGLRTMGLRGKNPFGEYLLGLAAGFVLFAAVIAVGCAAGCFRILSWSPAVSSVPMLLLFGLAFLVQGAAEEMLVRGYLATSLGARFPVPVAVLVSSSMFTMLHTGNDGFTLLAGVNVFLMGTILCVYMIKRGSIWGVLAIHSMWNFAQGCVFGLPVSGIQTGQAIISVKTESLRTMLTGGDFGPEAGICTTVVLIAALGLVLALRAKDPAAPVPAQEGSESENTPE